MFAWTVHHPDQSHQRSGPAGSVEHRACLHPWPNRASKHSPHLQAPTE